MQQTSLNIFTDGATWNSSKNGLHLLKRRPIGLFSVYINPLCRRHSTTSCPGCYRRWGMISEKCVVSKIIFCTGLTRAAKAGQKNIKPVGLQVSKKNINLKIYEPTKEGPLSYVLQESPFASVSTVSRGHPSLISLVKRLGLGEFQNFSSKSCIYNT